MSSFEGIVPTCKLREQLRSYRANQRTARRESEVDSLRLSLGDIRSAINEAENLTVRDVEGLCLRIKRRKRACKEDTFRLSHAFLQGNENIVAFVYNTGALNVLIKELTGHDAECQIRSCEALCNLSLGEAFSCEKIASYAGSYLVTYLDSTDVRIKTTSLWIITNIAATGGKGLTVLISLEIVPKLLHLWSTEKDQGIIRDIITAIDLFVCSNALRPEDKDSLRRNMFAKRPSTAFDEYHLKIIFEALISKDIHLTDNEILYLVNFSMYNMTHTTELLTSSKILRVIYSLRILSNLISLYPFAASILADSAKSSNVHIPDVLNRLLEKEIGVQEVLWVIRNLSSCQMCEIQIYLQEYNFLEDLKVGRFNIAKYLYGS